MCITNNKNPVEAGRGLYLHRESLLSGGQAEGIRFCGFDSIAIREAVNHENGVI